MTKSVFQEAKVDMSLRVIVSKKKKIRYKKDISNAQSRFNYANFREIHQKFPFSSSE